MTLFTSNFARVKKILAPLVPVAISTGLPWFVKIERTYDALAPGRKLLASETIEEFEAGYLRKLARMSAKKVVDDLGDNAVMLCWESPGVKCHRRLVAEWLESKLGIVVCELGFERDETLSFSESKRKGEK